MRRCLLIDGNNILFRAYFAFQRQRLKTRDGKPTGAIYGFLRMLLKMLKERKPELVAVAFDTSKNTFRKKLFPDYKAKRKPTPEELLDQIPYAHKLVEALGIKVLTNDDYEADDLIGSVAELLKNRYQIEVVTGDRDLLQLIDDNVLVELCQKGVSETKEIDAKAFEEEYGFPPAGIIELKALMGDSSDNIPGVKGIGEKKGMALVQKFLNIENLYREIEKVDNDKMKQKLIEDKEMAFLSRDLATIRRDVKCIDSPEELVWKEENLESQEFVSLLQELEFNSLYREFAGKDISSLERAEPARQKKIELTGERLLVKDPSELKRFLNAAGNKLCIDIETDGFDPFSNNIVGVSFASSRTKAIYVPLRHSYLGLSSCDQMPENEFYKILNDAIIDKIIIGHNLKFDLSFLAQAQVKFGKRLFDTLIAAYVIDPTRSNALKNLGKELFNFEVEDYKTVAGNKSFAEVDLASAVNYACQDALLTMHLYEHFTAELHKSKLDKLFDELEMPLIPILMGMERAGIRLNENYLKELSSEINDRLAELEASIHAHAGRIFNVNSTKQLQEVLFHDLGLNPPKKTKTGYSTDSEVLERLSDFHPICRYLLEYRELSKLKSTYADTLPGLVNPKTHLIHASFNQAVTATGRLSSSNPNMQNIPIKTEWGRKIRRAFEPPFEGHKFVSIDYSQIELRLLAHFSQDPDLIRAYEAGIDIHAITAGKIFKKDPEKVSSSERNIGKTVNFGILYGISAHGLAEDLNISRPQAKEYIDSFYKSFSRVTEFFDSVVKKARETKEVETLLGRVRHIPDITSPKFQIRSGAERIAKNTRLQGSAADLVKKAMIDTSEMLCEEGYQARLILQIHDELVFSVPEGEIKEVVPKLKHTMENCVKLNVPLICDVTVGDNLADLKDFA
ncbi:MAG: DNA polymerase I [Candidatus Rifleibacteriota bacterium]